LIIEGESQKMRNALKDIVETARALAQNKSAVLLFFVTYVALLATLSLFILTREATVKDLLVTLITMIAVPVLFCLLQAMCVTYLSTAGVVELLKESLAILRKLVIATIPFIVIGLLTYVMLGMIETRLSPGMSGRRLGTFTQGGESWPHVLISAARLVIFGMVLPLASIHIWIEARRLDLRQLLRAIKPIMARAFALRSVEIYVVGFALFGILPYILKSVRAPTERAWLEISLLGVQLILALALNLVGWVLTVGALQRATLATGQCDE